jgi:glutamyl-tRNA reductase
MSIFVIGFNYKTASISIREKVYFALDKLPFYLQDVLSRGHAREAVLLSTCNRSELYCDSDDIGAVRDWFCAQTTESQQLFESALYVYRDEEAIGHIMQVACGLDSMILGEPQILGQMKDAFSESCTAGSVGPVFHRLFQQIFTVAKEIRTTTAIGACPVSVASAAVHFAKQQFPVFAEANVALIGAGETAELLVRYLAKQVETPISLVCRNQDKATALMEECDGNVYELTDLPATLVRADIVFSATSSAIPVVNKKVMLDVMDVRCDRPIILVDLAVPRDIEPAIAEIPHVHLYCIDDLKCIIEQNRKGREHAAEKASEMIGKKSREFLVELQSLDKVAHTIRAYRSQVEELCRIELLKAKHQLYQGVDSAEVLDTFAHAFTKKLMHTPSVQLRQAGAEGRFELLRFAKQLFSLPDPETELL